MGREGSRVSTARSSAGVPCPICGRPFAIEFIAEHADTCASRLERANKLPGERQQREPPPRAPAAAAHACCSCTRVRRSLTQAERGPSTWVIAPSCSHALLPRCHRRARAPAPTRDYDCWAAQQRSRNCLARSSPRRHPPLPRSPSACAGASARLAREGGLSPLDAVVRPRRSGRCRRV